MITGGVKSRLFKQFRIWRRQRSLLGDLLGGIAGGAVAIPQSMGLGLVLFTTIGLDASTGAMAGLLGAAVLCLSSGLVGATGGMISAPNGPVTMLLVASLSSLVASGMQGSEVLLALTVILLIAGLFQLLIAFSGGGNLVKYIPFPAVAGLVAGIGILMIRSQLHSLTLGESDAIDGFWNGIPLLAALMTLAGIKLTQKYLSLIPGVIGGLLIGVIGYHLLVLAMPGTAPATWVVGTIPTLHRIDIIPEVSTLATLPWLDIVVTALAVALLASIDCLLTAVVADGRTGMRHNARRELAAQGTAQILTGLLGGVGGGGTKGSTLVAIDTGGRRWPAVVAGLTFLSLLLFMGPVGQLLPVSVLAGIIIYVGISMVDVNIVSWMQQRRLRTDALVAMAVIVTTVTYGLLPGLVVGVVGSVILFIRGQLLLPVIHERATGKERRSLNERSDEERQLLEENGDRIVYVELRGNLFFGTADRLFNELMADLDRPVWMVLNMRRVQHIDTSAMYLLRQMAARLRRNGGSMVYANIYKHSSGIRKINKAFRQLGRTVDLPKVKTFGSTDAAMEYAENKLLRSLGCEPLGGGRSVDLAGNKLCTDLNATAIEALSAVLRPLTLAPKKLVYMQGEYGDAVYLILNGEVEIRLPTGRYHYKRLAKIGPGGYFGCVGFLLSGLRSTSAIVTNNAQLLVFDRAALRQLENSGESRAVRNILDSIAMTVTKQLRWVRAELARIESS